MSNRILCAVDASAASGCAAGVAARLNRELNAECVLMHVEPPRIPTHHGLASISHARERGRLNALVEGHDFTDHTRVRVATGDPGRELIRAVERHDVELVVIGSRGTSAPEGTLGDVSAQLIRRAPCPVVVVPPEAEPPFAPDGIESVVCAVGDTERERQVLRLGADLSARLGGDLHAVHAFRARLMHPAAAVLSLAEEMCADLVVVGGDQRGRLGSLLADPLALPLAASAASPIVVLPPGAGLGAGTGHYELAAWAA